jgi:GTP-binding protein Era
LGQLSKMILPQAGTRSGFVALAGRPNVGKSTLANAIVGTKVAIVSDKPQTTRRAIRGVATGPDWQLILVDLPGVQRPRDALTERMQHRVESELADADGCLLLLNAQQGLGPGDRFIAGLLRKATGAGGMPISIAVNKVDRAEKARVAATLADAEGLDLGGEISDQAHSVRLAELVREQVLARTREEVPHAVEVEVEEILYPRPDLVRIQAVLLTETESQKGILIGAGGRMIKSIGVAARRMIERELGSKVHLELSVRVRRHWRTDERVLDRLGIE